MDQTSFFGKSAFVFGGILLTSHPKRKRPLDSKFPIHLVLKANSRSLRTFKHLQVVNEVFEKTCRKYGVRIYEFANCGDHLHSLIRIRHRTDWSAFIRELTGRLARRIGKGLWKYRPFTRVVRGWRKPYQIVKEYIQLNRLESENNLTRAEAKRLQKVARQVSS